jgi:hypothetical protein
MVIFFFLFLFFFFKFYLFLHFKPFRCSHNDNIAMFGIGFKSFQFLKTF